MEELMQDRRSNVKDDTVEMKIEVSPPKTNPVEIFGSSIPMHPPVNAPTANKRVAITLKSLYRGSIYRKQVHELEDKHRLLTEIKENIASKETGS